MAFSIKTWVDRISEYPNRRKLTHENGSTELVTVARAEGQVSKEGNAFSAKEMNDLEKRISDEFTKVNEGLSNWKTISPAINTGALTQNKPTVLVNETLRLVVFSLEFLTIANGSDLTLFNPPDGYYPKNSFSGVAIIGNYGKDDGLLYATPTGFKCSLPNNGQCWYRTFFVYNY